MSQSMTLPQLNTLRPTKTKDEDSDDKGTESLFDMVHIFFFNFKFSNLQLPTGYFLLVFMAFWISSI